MQIEVGVGCIRLISVWYSVQFLMIGNYISRHNITKNLYVLK